MKSVRKRRLRAGLLVSMIALLSCVAEEDPRTASTRQMVERLQAIREAAVQSGNYPYFVDRGLQHYEQTLAGLPFGLASEDRLNYASLLLLKGNNQACIDQLEGHLKAMNALDQVSLTSLRFHKLLAYAHLRQGEQLNCINHHSAESCILPLAGGGIHVDSFGATAAVRYYTRLLEYNPQDAQSRWFLNIAYMALGAYPDQIPRPYLLPESAFASDTTFPRFPNIAMGLGLDENNHAGGSSLEDFNNDGYLDIFTTSYGLADQSKLFLNQGDGQFRDATETAGLRGIVGGLNNIHGDVNQDGMVDIFVTRGAWLKELGRIPNSLLINRGDGKFSDITEAAGLLSLHPSNTSAFADINLDGKLDLFVGNESGFDTHSCEMYVNTGNDSNGYPTFSDRASPLRLLVNAFVKGVAWGDINNDMLPDLYVSVFGGENYLFVNRGGDSLENWRFEEISQAAGVKEPYHSFSCWFWDVNQDGWQDMMVFGYIHQPPDNVPGEVLKDYLNEPFEGELPRVYLNNGDETFRDAAPEMGLNTLLYTMGSNFGDLDNDGYPDFYTGNGEFNLLATVPDRMFRNDRGRTFQDVTTAGGFGQIQKGHGISFGDLDNDGDQDIYHQVGGAAEGDVYHNMLFQNPGFGNRWITLRLRGTRANASAIGARIELVTSEGENKTRRIYHQVSTGGSFGANSLQAEIGLGSAQSVDSIIVRWPDQARSEQVFTDVAPDTVYDLVQGDSLKALSVPPIPLEARHHP